MRRGVTITLTALTTLALGCAKTEKAADTAPVCPVHGVPMKQNHGKDGRTWYSHKTDAGWCKGGRP